MKLLLVAVNAKYIHTNLAVRYLCAAVCDMCDVSIREYSINDTTFAIKKDIFRCQPDVVAFSCYLWNIRMVLSLCSDLKKALPNLTILLGGPEVSFDAKAVLQQNTSVDYVVKGEGEITFPLLVKYIMGEGSFPKIGLAYRENGQATEQPQSLPVPFDKIPFPYKNTDFCNHKIIYYESSRGCPYACKYCLSGERGNVRFKDIDLVLKDLQFFIDRDVPLVKFVDRTFNADRKRAVCIWDYIGKAHCRTRFHMELAGDLIDDDTISVLKTVNPDNLQFEIGVQTTNPKTMQSIDRTCDNVVLFANIRRLLRETNIHIHLDLIAGLPHEDMNSFKKSFDDVISLRPHVLQLGFLKLLKGSKLREEAPDYGAKYSCEPPYEIISNQYMNFEEIILLKSVDFAVDKYYNSAAFSKTINYLFEKFDNKFEMFQKLAAFIERQNSEQVSISKAKLYDLLYECFASFGTDFEEALRYDYIFNMHSGKLPYWCKTHDIKAFNDAIFAFLKNEELKQKIMPEYYNVAAKLIVKHVRFEKFSYGVFMFDFAKDKVYNVTDYIQI